MLEVNNIVRLNLILLERILVLAVLDKLPKTFWLVLVDDINTTTNRLLNTWPVLVVVITLVLPIELSDLVRPVEDNRHLSVREIHVAIRLGMVNPQTIVEVNIVALMLVGTMRNQFENQLTRQLLSQL